MQNQCEKETTLKELKMQQRREERKVVHLTNQNAQNKHEALTQMLIQQQQQEQCVETCCSCNVAELTSGIFSELF